MAAKADACFDVNMINVKKISSFQTKVRPLSITTAGNNTAWVGSQFSDTMHLYDKDGNVVRSLTIMVDKRINDKMVTPSGEIIVSHQDKKVRCVSASGEVSTLIDVGSFYVLGMCLTDNGEIVMCMRDHGEENHIAVYSSDGRQKLKEFRGRDAQGKQLITDPHCVVQNGGDLCVVNVGRNVLCVDERDDVRWVYDGKQAELEEAFNPFRICRDKYHNLLVTDFNNHCVHYIDREGQLIQVILTQEQIGLQFPWGICVDDETGQVWIGSSTTNNDVVVATYLRQK